MVVFDATFLSHLLYPASKAPLDPSTHQPVVRAKERIEFLIGTLYQSGQKIIIPTPVLAEILVAVPNPREVLQIIGSFSPRCARLSFSHVLMRCLATKPHKKYRLAVL